MASKAYNIPNLLTYGRILAVPLIVLCFFWTASCPVRTRRAGRRSQFS
nr:hypothetical protein [Marinicella sp. W31]MDC2876964.1 hypothetical protein [Marinicella sp. W31]